MYDMISMEFVSFGCIGGLFTASKRQKSMRRARKSSQPSIIKNVAGIRESRALSDTK